MKIAIAVTAVALAAGGAGVAQAVGGGDDDGGRPEKNERADGGNLSGDAKSRAERSALTASGGGTVVEAEKGDDGDGAYEVAVRQRDGRVVEYHLDRGFKVVGSERE